MILVGKKIVLGVSGGIVVYKILELVCWLCECGVEVCVVMMEVVKVFIILFSLQVVFGYLVFDSLFDLVVEVVMGYIEFGKWVDLVIFVLVIVDLIVCVVVGMVNDLVLMICFVILFLVVVVFVMNQQMYCVQVIQYNLQMFVICGLLLWGLDSGSQVCGDVGLGRMFDLLIIVDMVVQYFVFFVKDL